MQKPCAKKRAASAQGLPEFYIRETWSTGLIVMTLIRGERPAFILDNKRSSHLVKQLLLMERKKVLLKDKII